MDVRTPVVLTVAAKVCAPKVDYATFTDRRVKSHGGVGGWVHACGEGNPRDTTARYPSRYTGGSADSIVLG